MPRPRSAGLGPAVFTVRTCGFPRMFQCRTKRCPPVDGPQVHLQEHVVRATHLRRADTGPDCPRHGQRNERLRSTLPWSVSLWRAGPAPPGPGLRVSVSRSTVLRRAKRFPDRILPPRECGRRRVRDHQAPPLRHGPCRPRDTTSHRPAARPGDISAGRVAGPATRHRSRPPRPWPVLRPRSRRRSTAGRPFADRWHLWHNLS